MIVVEALVPSACLFSSALENKRRYNARLFCHSDRSGGISDYFCRGELIQNGNIQRCLDSARHDKEVAAVHRTAMAIEVNRLYYLVSPRPLDNGAGRGATWRAR